MGGVKDVSQHGSQLRAGYTLVFIEVEHSEEEHAAIVEGAVQHHCQATHKLLKADLAILYRWGEVIYTVDIMMEFWTVLDPHRREYTFREWSGFRD